MAIEKRKFCYGDIKLCNNFNKDNIEESIDTSADYMKEAFLFKVDDENYLLIEDGPDSDLTNFICLVPTESLYGRGDLFPNKPRSPFDMFVDERTLKPYKGISYNSNKEK